MATPMPTWASELVTLYESGASNQFVLHGNVSDRMLLPISEQASIGTLKDYLYRILLKPFDVVLTYDVGNGLRVEKGGEQFSQWPEVARTPHLPRAPRPAVEFLTHYFRYVSNLRVLGKPSATVGCIIDMANLAIPTTDGAFNPDINTIVLLVREWANDPAIRSHSVATFLITENLSDLHPLVTNNGHTAKVKVPLPDPTTLEASIAHLAPSYDTALAGYKDRMAALSQQLTGTTLGSIEQLLKTSQYKKTALDPKSLVKLKRTMVEEEYGGLVGFLESTRTLDNIHGHDNIKQWLRQDIALWAQNDLKAIPMGYLLCGPVGTGKTFFVDCLAGEAGVPVVKLKNFRDKWVGSTEGNLEKIFRLLHALGRCVVFVDEADQALGRRVTNSGDSGISGRVYSMIAEEMSNTDNRGKIMWILASSRPDLIEVDLKRPGRVDVKIPLFPTLTPEEGFGLIRALAGRIGLELAEGAFAELSGMVPMMLTPGAAEALTVKAYRLSRTKGLNAVEALKACLEHYQLPVPKDVMEFQIGLAIREASDLDFVPEILKGQIDYYSSKAAGF